MIKLKKKGKLLTALGATLSLMQLNHNA